MEPRKIHLNVMGSRATCRFSHPSRQRSDRIPFESGPSIAIVLHFRFGVGCPSFRPIQTLVLVDGRATSILSTSTLDGLRPKRCGVGFRLKRRGSIGPVLHPSWEGGGSEIPWPNRAWRFRTMDGTTAWRLEGLLDVDTGECNTCIHPLST
eukprot:scaffold287_cov337-Pavlova_lutheri.AAC.4